MQQHVPDLQCLLKELVLHVPTKNIPGIYYTRAPGRGGMERTGSVMYLWYCCSDAGMHASMYASGYTRPSLESYHTRT